MNETWNEMFAFMDRLGAVLDDMTAIQREKADAVLRDDLLAVDGCMKREQAITLSLRSMDQKRSKLLNALGLGDVAASSLPALCPAEKRAEAKAASEKLLQRFGVYRSAADAARTVLEVNLHQIEKIIETRSDGVSETGSGLADIRA